MFLRIEKRERAIASCVGVLDSSAAAKAIKKKKKKKKATGTQENANYADGGSRQSLALGQQQSTLLLPTFDFQS